MTLLKCGVILVGEIDAKIKNKFKFIFKGISAMMYLTRHTLLKLETNKQGV